MDTASLFKTIDTLDIEDKPVMLATALAFTRDEIDALVQLLKRKHDKRQYYTSLLLQLRSEHTGDLYKYFEEFAHLVEDTNTYRRSIGFSLLARNTKWDEADKISPVIDRCLHSIAESKPIAVRKMVGDLTYIAYYKPVVKGKLTAFLRKFNLERFNGNMRPLIEKDIAAALHCIEKNEIL